MPAELLRWVYLARVALALVPLALRVILGGDSPPLLIAAAPAALAATILVTLPAWWHTHGVRRAPGPVFLYGQVLFDVLLVTLLVHLTGSGESPLAPLYIVVIAVAALLLPFAGGVLMGVLASTLFFADVALGSAEGAVAGATLFQLGIFALVAIASGMLGDRVRAERRERSRSEARLSRLRMETAEILARIPTAVLTVGPAGEILYRNRAGEALPSRGFQESGAPLDLSGFPDPIRTGIEDALGNPGAGGRRIELFDPPRGRRVFEVRVARPPDSSGEGSDPATALIEEVTDRERIAEVRERNSRLEAVAELSASMAHEIRNPLASIRSAVEQLAGSQPPSEDDREALRRLVSRESERLSRLLSDFIEFAGLGEVAGAPVPLAEALRKAIRMVEEHPDARGAGVRIELAPDLPDLEVRGDPELLHRAFTNLILNGAQAAGAGGWVRISVARRGDQARVAIEDSGAGIASDIAGRIFDPFFSTRRGGGGLGLAIVHRVVEAHRGAIELETGGDHGARFLLDLPLAPEPHGGEPAVTEGT